MAYMTPDHPDAFNDFPGEKPQGAFRRKCGRCRGYGGWNLKLFAYFLAPHLEDTPENRHRQHFRASCSSCFGFGWTNDDCDHEYRRVKRLRMCLHLHRCQTCGKEITVDSSD